MKFFIARFLIAVAIAATPYMTDTSNLVPGFQPTQSVDTIDNHKEFKSSEIAQV